MSKYNDIHANRVPLVLQGLIELTFVIAHHFYLFIFVVVVLFSKIVLKLLLAIAVLSREITSLFYRFITSLHHVSI